VTWVEVRAGKRKRAKGNPDPAWIEMRAGNRKRAEGNPDPGLKGDMG
jgi:hypothetical protein